MRLLFWSRKPSSSWRRARKPKASTSHPSSTTGCRANVVGDAARLRQVLLNLAGNAIKFTEKGGVAVIVEPDAQPDEIRFQVRDTGIGLAPQDQARIFLDFEQADGSATRKFGGTGLGLAISKRIVERMDGGITVDSEAGRGATFTFQRAAARQRPAATPQRIS